jgi:ATP-dependent protease ClpP protease subunit
MPWIDLPTGLQAAPGPQADLSERRRWFEFRNAGDDEAELLLFDLVGGWFGIYADEFVAQLNAITARTLTVRVNSPGGSVFEGVAIANALRAHPAAVTVRVEGLAASIASVIALAGEKLVMAPNSMFMIHDASCSTWGDAAEMRKTAEVLDKISDNIADAYAVKAGGTRAEWRGRMLAETWYTADEAVEAGLADELMVPPKLDDPDEGLDDAAARMTAQWDLSLFGYAGRLQTPPPEGDAGAHGGRLPYPLSLAATPKDQAPAAARSRIPLATPHTLHAEPVEQPAPAPVLVDVEATRAALTPQPATGTGPDGPATDPWADLVAHLLPTAESSADDLLAHLREA